MYQKVHLRLTLLCAGITASIMIVMSLFSLYISEKGLYNNQFQSFKNDINTITINLEQQNIITMEWLSKMETQGNYLFFVIDNGVPFLYNDLNDTKENSSKKRLLEENLTACRNKYEISLEEDNPASYTSNSYYQSYHLEYEFTSSSTDTRYFGGLIHMEKGSSSLEVAVLSSLTFLDKQIWSQRIRFLLINAAAILFLSLFSWIFTGKLLKPIMENQQKQIQFVASASHELRTPLAVILSAAECLKTAAPLEKADFFKTIQSEGARMSALINDMLTLSQSDSCHFSIQKCAAELDTLLINTCDAFEPLAKEKSITISINLPESAIPPCSADSERISQVISILLHNAISYTPEGGRVMLSLFYKKDNFYIEVEDNGIGISDEDKKRIFDRFYRAEKSRSAKGHFGLGLSIASEIVKAHGGSLTVADAGCGKNPSATVADGGKNQSLTAAGQRGNFSKTDAGRSGSLFTVTLPKG